MQSLCYEWAMTTTLQNCISGKVWPISLPRDSSDEVYQVINSPVENVQRMAIEERGRLPVYRFTLIIDLEVTFPEFGMGVVLMPAQHELSLRFDPVDAIKVVAVVLGNIERDVQFDCLDLIVGTEECCASRLARTLILFPADV